jgi:hypothetical protein
MVAYKKLSPNHSGQRTHSIDRITPHCVVGQCTAEGLGEWFEKTSTQASSNYGIDKDGRVGLYVEEKNRSWCSSSSANDQRAITIECASDTSEPYAFRDVVYQTLIKLCTDICKRNGKKKLLWLGDKDKTLNYSPAVDEMILTVHRWFANKSCPGNWMYAGLKGCTDYKKAIQIIKDGGYATDTSYVSKICSIIERWNLTQYDVKPAPAPEPEPKPTPDKPAVPFLVKVSISDLNIRRGPGTNFGRTQFIPRGVYTIVATSAGPGATLWGKLKSGAGWISLDYCTRL